jgi:hypothetical protein
MHKYHARLRAVLNKLFLSVLLLPVTSIQCGATSVDTLGALQFGLTFQLTGTSSTVFAFPVLTFDATGTGILNDTLGNSMSTAYSSSGQVDLLRTNPDGSHPSSGTFLFSGSGYELFGSYGGTSFSPNSSGDIVFTPILTMTGGTGRFAGASGSATASGITNVNTAVFTLSGTGQIAIIPEPSTFMMSAAALIIGILSVRILRGASV